MTVEPNSPTTRPFMPAPDPQRYFPAQGVEEARQRLLRTIARQEGPALICGVAGVGKSLLLEMLADHFADELSVVQLAASQFCSRRELLQAILFQLNLPYRGLDDGELRLSVFTHLGGHSTGSARPGRMLLLVDEAESLSIELLEELRGLSNLIDRGGALVSLVLAGAAAVEEHFADARLGGFSQRVATRCYLAPLAREETFQYLRAQIAATGDDPDQLLTSSALEAIYAATDGVPRLINQIGDQLLWVFRQGVVSCLDAAAVQQVWSELQQLPAPWNVAAPEKNRPEELEEAEVVEFGPLSDAVEPTETGDVQAVEFGDDAVVAPRATDDESLDGPDDELPSSIPIGLPPVDEAATIDAATIDAAELAGHDGFIDPFGEFFDEEESLDDRYAQFELQMLRAAPQVRNQLDAAFAGDLSRAGVLAEADPVDLKPDEGIAQRQLPHFLPPHPALSPRGEGAKEKLFLSDSEVELQGAAAAPATAPETFDVGPDVVDLDETSPPSLPLPVSEKPSDEALLVVEDDGRPSAEVVPSTQFRRLFSQLESAAG